MFEDALCFARMNGTSIFKRVMRIMKEDKGPPGLPLKEWNVSFGEKPSPRMSRVESMVQPLHATLQHWLCNHTALWDLEPTEQTHVCAEHDSLLQKKLLLLQPLPPSTLRPYLPFKLQVLEGDASRS